MAVADWEKATFKGMPYYLLKPVNFDPSVPVPTILFLHQFENETGEPKQVDAWFGSAMFRNNSAFRSIIIAPLCEIGSQTSSTTFNWGGVTADLQQPIVIALALQDQIQTQYKTDRGRAYVAGNSMGGLGIHGILANPAQRTAFAAFLPVSGSCYYKVGQEAAMAAALKSTPIWSCHGHKDPQVSPAYDEALYREMQKIGGIMKFTNDPNAEHDTWDSFFPRQDVWTWLFAQRKDGTVVNTPTKPASANGTLVAAGSTGAIIDSQGDTWTLVSAQVAVNGSIDATTKNVDRLVYSAGRVFQMNTDLLWWSKAQQSDAWKPDTAPIAAPVPTPPPTPAPTSAPVTVDAAAKANALERIDALIAKANSAIGDLVILKAVIGGL